MILTIAFNFVIVPHVSTTYCWYSFSDGVDYNLYSPYYSIALLHVPLTVGRFQSLNNISNHSTKIVINFKSIQYNVSSSAISVLQILKLNF